METWSLRTLVFVFPHSSSARSCHELADSGINTGTNSPRPHRHSSDFDVHRHLTSTLRSCWIRCHAVIVVLTASVAQHHRLLTLHFSTGMSATLLHELDLWNLLHDLTLVTSASFPLRAMDVKLTHRPSTTHLLFPSRVRAGLGSATLIKSTLSSFNCLIVS